MRLPWFFGPRPARRRPERGRHQSAPTLRVRQLERRRVLDAAGSTVVVDVALQSGQETTIATPVTNTDALEFNWVTPDATSESQAAVNSFGSSTDVSASGASTQPALIATVDQTVDEGSLLDLSGLNGASPLGLILDPDAGETHTAVVNWGDAPLTQFDPVTVFDDGGFAKPLGGTHTYADGPGVYTVTIRVADNTMSGDFVNGVNGVDFVEDTFTVTVNNVPPTLIISGNSTTDEGSTYTLNLSSSDPGDDTITSWEINWGDGTIENVLGNPSSVTHVYADGDAAYTISATATDEDGTFAANTLDVFVLNVAPTITSVNLSDTTIPEGQSVTVSGTFTDPALGVPTETFTVVIDWGNGATSVATVDNALGTYTATYTYADDHPDTGTPDDKFTITVTVTDDDGGSSSTADNNLPKPKVTVTNVAPTITAIDLSTTVLDEGQSLTVSGTFTDPALGQATETFTVVVNWGNGDTSVAVVDAALGTYTATYLYRDDHPRSGTDQDIFSITVEIVDDDGGSYHSSANPDLDRCVTVRNVAPAVSLDAVTPVNENGVATLTGSYTDIGILDTHTVVVDWDDPNDTHVIDWDDPNNCDLSSFTIPAIRDAAGNPTLAVGQTIASSTDEAVLTITAINATTGQVSFSVQHQYLDDGVAPGNSFSSDTSTITVTVADDDTGSNAASTTVVVNNVNPVLTVSAPITINEGSLLDLLGSGGSPTVGNFTDVGTLDRHATQIDWGDGHVEIGTVIQSAGGGLIIGSHTYADDGVYTVIVRLADDDMGAFASPDKFNTGIAGVDYVQATFTVTVLNVAPSLTDGGPANVVDEGSSFVLSDLGGGQSHLGIGLSDPGFDNPLNPTTPALGNPFSELFVGYTIDWGDGTADTPVNVVMRNNGAPGSATTALFEHAAHTYADNGTYTVRVRVADDNMGAYHDASLFETGVEGVDFVDLTFTITVNNVAPTMTVPVVSAGTINENGSVSFNVSFSDPGFDNPLNDNTPPNGGEVEESFTYDIDWGDNRQTLGNVAVAATPGGVGVPSQGSFGGSHVYADDGTYTVTVTIHDDDGGSFTRQFNVVVQNVAPQFIPQPDGSSFQGDDINTSGVTTIRVGYRDPGFDNPANPNSPVLPHISNTQHEVFTHVLNWGDGSIDALHTYANDGIYTITITISGADLNGTFTFTDFVGSNTSLLTLVSGQTLNVPGASAYTYTVDWGDGTIQTISLTLNQPLVPLAVAPRTTVLVADRVSGDIGVHTTGGFEVQHKYTGPPNPLNPSADIAITVTVMDDNNGFVAGTIFVPNPGIETINVAIDTTPQVPRLEYLPPAPPQPLLNQSTATILGLQSNDVGGGGGDSAVTSERFLELVAYAPDGSEVGRYRLQEEALADLRSLFAKLPDGHYKIFLVRTDNNSRRLVMEVYVRRGRVIDPSDDSEGIRDRPPTSEAEERPQAVPAAKPGENREKPDAASLPRDEYAPMPSVVFDDDVLDLAMPTDSQPAAISYSALRWRTALAGVAVAAGARPWSSTVESAFAEADGRAWQRLRRAGRLGGSPRRGIKPTTTQDRPKN